MNKYSLALNNKIKNFPVNQLIGVLNDENCIYTGGTLKGNIKRKIKSNKYEPIILNAIASDKRVKEIYYYNDYTEKKYNYCGRGYLSIQELEENTLNMFGADIAIQTHDSFFADLKVLNYHEKYYKNNKIYNGKLDSKYGMENMLLQYEGIRNKEGWANSINKLCKYIFIYVPETTFLYVLDYKKLNKYVNELIEYDDNLIKITFEKHIWENKYKKIYYEKCISTPIKDLIENKVIVKYSKLDKKK